jgi:cytochrome c-type biogenesis protein CcmH
MIRRLVLLLSLLLAPAALAIGVDENRLPDPAMEARARALMQELRCLVCQNQSISDSDAPLAADLRQIVRERLAAGDDEAQVKAFLVARYGDWVLLEPPLRAGTLLLWAGPALLLLGTGAWLLLRHRRASVAPLSADEETALSDLLK